MTPHFNHGDKVEVKIKGKIIIGRVRGRSYGWDARRIEPEYEILPDGELSIKTLIRATQSNMKRVKHDAVHP